METATVLVMPKVKKEGSKKHRRGRGQGSVYQPEFTGPDGRARKGNWRIRFTYRDELGVRHVHDEKVEGPEVNKTVAQSLLQKRKAELANGKFVFDTPAETLTYRDLRAMLLRHYEDTSCKSLLTAKDGKTKYISSLNHLDAYFDADENATSLRALAIKHPLVESFKDKRKEQGASNCSINRSLGLLRQMFALAVEAKFPSDRVPTISMLAEPKPREGFLRYDNFIKLRGALPAYLEVPVTLGYRTGMRLSEIMNLRWEYVDLKGREILLPPGYCKNNQPRIVPLTTEVCEMLKPLRSEKSNSQFVFLRDGQRLYTFRKAWNRACVAVGLGRWEPMVNRKTGEPILRKDKPVMRYRGLIFHDLRRSAVSNLVRSGVPLPTAMAISGHRTISVFTRYNIIDPKTLQVAMDGTDDYLDSIIQSQSKVDAESDVSRHSHKIN